MATRAIELRTQPSASSAERATVTWANMIRSEWTKFWSLRSTYWTLIALVVLTVGLSAGMSRATVTSNGDEMAGMRSDPVGTSLSGLDTGQLVIVVLGVMMISTEYATRNIRTALIAAPRRLTFLGAKALVLAVVATVAGILTSFASFFVGQAILGTDGLNVQLSDPGVFRAVVGGGLYLAGSAMAGFALGALLRSLVGGIAVAVAGLIVLPQLARMLPGNWGEWIEKVFTSNAGMQVARVVHDGSQLGPWTGYLVFTLWWMAPLAIAAVMMLRRDV
jgi:hypothetical protein